MLIHADVKGLEVVTAAYLSQDEVLCTEIRDKVDTHEENQKRFGLPTRLVAKTFKFRLIYGGSAYGYAHDPEFTAVSRSQKYWQDVIDEYYHKYSGMAKWHNSLVEEVKRSRKIVLPTGREFHFEPLVFRGEHKWPRTQILNYPVQGTGADLVAIARVTMHKRLKALKYPVLFQSTVHDSVDIDCLDNDLGMVYNVCQVIKQSVEDVPLNFYRLFGAVFNLPVSCEIGFGRNLGDLQEYA